MAEHDTPDRGDDRPRMRIGDAERQRMIDTLQTHLGAGRLDMPEYERRVERATGAVYADDLEGLLDDLPRVDGGPDEASGGRRSRRGPTDERSDRREWWPTGRDAVRRGRGWAVPVPLLVIGAVALAVVTNGWILVPLLFLLAKGGRGPCGVRRHRVHHHRSGQAGGHHHEAGRDRGRRDEEWTL